MKFKFDDTIAAIATAPGRSGIGIVRMSGPDALRILREIFVNKDKRACEKFSSHMMRYGFIRSEDGIIDEVMATYMRAPRSYTCEDVAEINCHGGTAAVTQVLALVVAKGARLAEHGEFTRRAFMNGRIDLSQAEAVMELVNSRTALSGRAAVTRLRGGLSDAVKEMNAELLTLLAHIEVSIDYPEHDSETYNIELIKQKAYTLLSKVEKLIKTAETGRILSEGIDTVMAGRPNVGKSSILNALLDEERAIVTDIPGTTRDFISECVSLYGVPLKLTDTAGIRDTSDAVEKIGVERSRNYLRSADLILFVTDASEPLTREDFEIYDTIKDLRHIVLANKSDKPPAGGYDTLGIPDGNIFRVCALNREGFAHVLEKIREMFLAGDIQTDGEVLISGLRNKTSLENAADSLRSAISAAESGMAEDLIAIDLQACYGYLGEITGETLDAELLDKIFSEFCLGK